MYTASILSRATASRWLLTFDITIMILILILATKQSCCMHVAAVHDMYLLEAICIAVV